MDVNGLFCKTGPPTTFEWIAVVGVDKNPLEFCKIKKIKHRNRISRKLKNDDHPFFNYLQNMNIYRSIRKRSFRVCRTMLFDLSDEDTLEIVKNQGTRTMEEFSTNEQVCLDSSYAVFLLSLYIVSLFPSNVVLVVVDDSSLSLPSSLCTAFVRSCSLNCLLHRTNMWPIETSDVSSIRMIFRLISDNATFSYRY